MPTTTEGVNAHLVLQLHHLLPEDFERGQRAEDGVGQQKEDQLRRNRPDTAKRRISVLYDD